jgi:hypothetical protein
MLLFWWLFPPGGDESGGGTQTGTGSAGSGGGGQGGQEGSCGGDYCIIAEPIANELSREQLQVLQSRVIRAALKDPDIQRLIADATKVHAAKIRDRHAQ